jgi:uncharacterized membrane-anchored protein YhcB (DUF1043 family)
MTEHYTWCHLLISLDIGVLLGCCVMGLLTAKCEGCRK